MSSKTVSTKSKNLQHPSERSLSYPTIGMNEHDRQTIATGLSHVLADAMAVYLTTHRFHWNVTGPMFHSLHALFAEQYTEQWNALDQIAERIRALGHLAPGSFQELSAMTTVGCANTPNEPLQWDAMVRILIEANEALCRTVRHVLTTAEHCHDASSADLLTERLQLHEKYLWMLRVILE